jgi:hypothetical protein
MECQLACTARQRYLLAVLSALGFCIMYAMRTAPSVAVLNIAKEFNYSPHTKGSFLGAFYYGSVGLRFGGWTDPGTAVAATHVSMTVLALAVQSPLRSV